MTTLVQIKRSSTNTSPTTLLAGELAYSYVSNVIFIGDSASGVMNIGGQYYTSLIDQGTAANSAATFVRRYANGSAQFSQLDILTAPTANNHVATKEYVDSAVLENIALTDLSDVSIPGTAADQNNRILIGNANGEFVSRSVSGNVSLSNTGVFTIGASQVTNSMLAGSITNDKLANSTIQVVGGAGLSNGGTVALGSSITLNVIAGDGISNANGDSVSVNSTVLRTDRNQTVNGFITFSNTVTITADLDVTGNIYLNGNTTYINVATLAIDDPLIYLGANNNLTDLVDIGFMGGHNTAGVYQHSGLIRDASDGNWYLFTGLSDEAHQNNIVDIANTKYALLNANLNAQQLNVTSGFANIATTLDVTGNTRLLSNLIVSSNATFSQNANVTGTVNVGSILAVTGNTSLLSNLAVSRNVTVSQNANVTGTLNVGSILSVTGNTQLLANLAVSRNVTISQNANVTGTFNVGSTLAVTGNATLLANVSVSQNANVTGTVNVGSILAVSGNTQLLSNLAVSRNVTVSQNANVTGTLNVGSLLAVSGNTSLLANVTVSQNANVTGTLNVGSRLDVTGNTTLRANVSVLQNANITGTLNVGSATWLSSLSLGSPLPTSSGGTGVNSFTANGVFYAGSTTSLNFATGTEGEILQIKAGVPTFDMLDGGSF